MGKDLNISPKKIYKWQQAYEKMLNIISHRKCKSKPQWEYFVSIKMTIKDQNKNNKCWQRCEKLEILW